MSASRIQVKYLGKTDYRETWETMKRFTDQRDASTPNELWITEHPPVYTQGQNGKPEHLLNPGKIPVIQIDRGGQVTYHGPGQLVLYCLLNLKSLGLGVRGLVTRLENAVIEFLKKHDIEAVARDTAPGVYVDEAKIAALGLRIRKGCCYHGLSLNIDMDLKPFSGINPCGYQGLAVTQLSDFGVNLDTRQAGFELSEILIQQLGKPSEKKSGSTGR
ncbi:MAG: lipoyl(octanoyl) transferase LipB [Pseudomonadota bacterium]